MEGTDRMDEILEKHRQEIDQIDQSIMDLLRRRFDVAEEIGQRKRMIGAAVLDVSREQLVLDARTEYAERIGLDPDFIKNLIQSIMDESKVLQNQPRA